MILVLNSSFWNFIQKCYFWFYNFCKNYGLFILVVGLFVFGVGFLITLIIAVNLNRKTLRDLIIERKDEAMTFQKTCVEDYESKQKMELQREKVEASSDEKVSVEEMLSVNDSTKIEIENSGILNLEGESKKMLE